MNLLSCPFCGETNMSLGYDRDAFTIFLECDDCGGRGPAISTLSNDPRDAPARILAAKDQWNQRGGKWEVDNASTA